MWNERAAQGLLIIVGLVHVLPSFVALSPEAAQTAYGIDLTSGDVEVLLRHRAVLLGLLGCGLILAAFRETLRTAMIAAAALAGLAVAVAVAALPTKDT